MAINPITGFSVDRTPSETTDYDMMKYHYDFNEPTYSRNANPKEYKNYEQRINRKPKNISL